MPCSRPESGCWTAHVGLAMNTVKRYARAATPERIQRVPKYRACMVDPYRDHLRARREQEPGVGATALLAEIRALGYTGSQNLLVRYLNQGRHLDDLPAPLTPAGRPTAAD
jgi:hypothetical protein